jgi:putative protease
MILVNVGAQPINRGMVLKRLKALNDTEYYIERLELENLQSDLYLPFKELTSIKKRLLFILNGSKEFIDPIDVPVLKKHNGLNNKPSLSVVISSQ